MKKLTIVFLSMIAAASFAAPPSIKYNPFTTNSGAISTPIQLTSSANVVHGAFTGNGAGLTNFNPAIVRSNSVYLYPGATTADFQSALDAGKFIYACFGNYTGLTNIYVRSNGCGLSLWGATLSCNPAITNAFIEFATNSDLKISGIFGGTLDGGESSTAWINNPKGLVIPYPNYPNYNNTCFSNRSGIYINLAAEGFISGMTVKGFPGYGYLIYNNNANSGVPFPRLQLGPCYGSRNYISACLSGWQFDNPYGALWNAEYSRLSGWDLRDSTIGLMATAANHTISSCMIVDNYCGVYIGHGTAHGSIDGNKINHSVYAAVYGKIYAAGEKIINNDIQGGGIIMLDSPVSVEIVNNTFSGSSNVIGIWMTNIAFPSYTNTPNIVQDNKYDGRYGTDFKIVLNSPNHCPVILGRNVSRTIYGDSDGTWSPTNVFSIPVSSLVVIPGLGTMVMENVHAYLPNGYGAIPRAINGSSYQWMNAQIPRNQIVGTNLQIIAAYVSTVNNNTLGATAGLTYVPDGATASQATTQTSNIVFAASSTRYWLTNTFTITNTAATMWIYVGTAGSPTPTNYIGLSDLMIKSWQ